MIPLDPFDLPEYLGTGPVTWTAIDAVRSGHHVRGELLAEAQAPHPCDLFAVDLAHPAPVADDRARVAAHQAWRLGEVHLADADGRLTLLMPGTGFDADGVLDAVSRLARAVGADPRSFSVRMRLGG